MPKRKCKPLNDLSQRHKIRVVTNSLSLSRPPHILEPIFHNDAVNTNATTTSCNSESRPNRPISEIPLFVNLSDSDNNPAIEEIPVVGLPQTTSEICNDHVRKNEQNFSAEMAEWATSENVSHSHCNKLLKILRRHDCFKDLPKDSRTLLKTPRSYNIRSVHPGSYYHFGIESGILETLKTVSITSISNPLKLHVNIDGMQIAKSSGSQFWPILGAINNMNSRPFLIAVYHGLKKPKCCNDYLIDFVEEVNSLLNSGITYNNQHFSLEISAFTCDTPARAFIKKIKGHNGYYGCDKCTTKGKHIDRRVVFPDDNGELRTDDDFIEKKCANHHVGTSILEKIEGIKMVSNFPNDYMHSMCLGTMRKLLFLWMKGKLPVRLSNNTMNRISTKLEEVKSLIPTDFARKPRSLFEIDKWKATEFRQLLLYTGPCVFKSCLPKKNYTHFLALNCAMRILTSPELSSKPTDLHEAHNLLKYFFKYFKQLYGKEQLSYNIHSVIHLVEDVRNFGPLDSFSAFKFESFLHDVKKKLRNCASPLQQIIRRISEERSIDKDCNSHSNDLHTSAVGTHSEGPLVDGTTNPQYKKLIFPNFVVSSSRKDSCVQLKDHTICIVENIATSGKETVIIGRRFLTMENFFTKPVPSSSVGIFKMSGLSGRCTWNTDMIASKALNLPIDDTFHYVSVLLHHSHL